MRPRPGNGNNIHMRAQYLSNCPWDGRPWSLSLILSRGAYAECCVPFDSFDRSQRRRTQSAMRALSGGPHWCCLREKTRVPMSVFRGLVWAITPTSVFMHSYLCTENVADRFTFYSFFSFLCARFVVFNCKKVIPSAVSTV